jgi:hypothetical protein
MPIVLSKQIEERLLERAKRAGRDANAIANEIIASSLDLEDEPPLESGNQEQIVLEPAQEVEATSLDHWMTEYRREHGYSDTWPSVQTDHDLRILESVLAGKPDDAVGQRLHCRKTEGEALTDQELATLQAWYDANDAEDMARMSLSQGPDFNDLDQEIEASKLRLDALVSQVRTLAQSNKKIREENDLLGSEITASSVQQ